MGNLRIYLHQASGQPPSCLEGLKQYAERASQAARAAQFPTLRSFLAWSWAQPVLYDHGEGPTVAGCDPAQRSRIWPTSGANCWEMVGMLLAAMEHQGCPAEVHVYDGPIHGQRHVWPAVRPLDSTAEPQALVLQPAVGGGASRPEMARVLQEAMRTDHFTQGPAQGLAPTATLLAGDRAQGMHWGGPWRGYGWGGGWGGWYYPTLGFGMGLATADLIGAEVADARSDELLAMAMMSRPWSGWAQGMPAQVPAQAQGFDDIMKEVGGVVAQVGGTVFGVPALGQAVNQGLNPLGSAPPPPPPTPRPPAGPSGPMPTSAVQQYLSDQDAADQDQDDDTDPPRARPSSGRRSAVQDYLSRQGGQSSRRRRTDDSGDGSKGTDAGSQDGGGDAGNQSDFGGGDDVAQGMGARAPAQGPVPCMCQALAAQGVPTPAPAPTYYYPVQAYMVGPWMSGPAQGVMMDDEEPVPTSRLRWQGNLLVLDSAPSPAGGALTPSAAERAERTGRTQERAQATTARPSLQWTGGRMVIQ